MAVGTGALLGAAAINSATSGGTSSGGSASSSQSFSQTYGTEASQRAAAAATSANDAAAAAWERAAKYNAEEAQKTRDWQERLANTTYQRTVADMIKAGINPVLAANMGLSADSVSSGATATMGNPMSYMANTYADSQSASQSQGSSWNESISGLAYLASAIGDAIKGITSANSFDINLNLAQKTIEDLVYKNNKDYTGANEKGKPDTKTGYTQHYDSDKKKYLTETEVQAETFLQGLERGLRNMTNAHLGIR